MMKIKLISRNLISLVNLNFRKRKTFLLNIFGLKCYLLGIPAYLYKDARTKVPPTLEAGCVSLNSLHSNFYSRENKNLTYRSCQVYRTIPVPTMKRKKKKKEEEKEQQRNERTEVSYGFLLWS